jgi:hypothetical protein
MLDGGDFTGRGGWPATRLEWWRPDDMTLPAVSDGLDGGVGGVDSEVWMALRHARLGGDLQGTTGER